MPLSMQRVTQGSDPVLKHLFNEASMTWDGPDERFFANDNHVLVWASLEDLPAGFAFGQVLYMPHKTAPLFFLYSIDVFPPYRRRGVATALLQWLLAWARKRGCSEMFVMTNDSNDAAMTLYERTGGIRESKDDVLFVYPLEPFSSPS